MKSGKLKKQGKQILYFVSLGQLLVFFLRLCISNPMVLSILFISVQFNCKFHMDKDTYYNKLLSQPCISHDFYCLNNIKIIASQQHSVLLSCFSKCGGRQSWSMGMIVRAFDRPSSGCG